MKLSLFLKAPNNLNEEEKKRSFFRFIPSLSLPHLVHASMINHPPNSQEKKKELLGSFRRP